MQKMTDESIDCILTDPPYKYLKNQKLERDFDENMFFKHSKRILKNSGLIVLFGRGTSFYRWNMILADLGFVFKEEIIWDKSYTTSPLMSISRVHETISIWAKKTGVINKVKVPYLEMKGSDLNSIRADINRLKTTFSNLKSLYAVEEYLKDGELTYDGDYVSSTTITNGKRRIDRCVAVAHQLEVGLNEKSIIKEIREHYTSIHPTQKPVRLLERLLALTSKKGDLILDPFSGSCSTGIACRNTGRNFIGFEIDEEYYQKALDRISGKNPNGFEKTEAGRQKINYGQTELNFD